MRVARTLKRARRKLYRAGSVLGDITAIADSVAQPSPAPAARRIGNKLIGRHIVRHLWLRPRRK